jgi:hypothetical protein
MPFHDTMVSSAVRAVEICDWVGIHDGKDRREQERSKEETSWNGTNRPDESVPAETPRVDWFEQAGR